jgi:hypothetical protein
MASCTKSLLALVVADVADDPRYRRGAHPKHAQHVRVTGPSSLRSMRLDAAVRADVVLNHGDVRPMYRTLSVLVEPLPGLRENSKRRVAASRWLSFRRFPSRSTAYSLPPAPRDLGVGVEEA